MAELNNKVYKKCCYLNSDGCCSNIESPLLEKKCEDPYGFRCTDYRDAWMKWVEYPDPPENIFPKSDIPMLTRDEMEFNRIASELSNKLKLCCRKDGVNYWYGNTVELLCQMIGFVFISNKNKENNDGKS